MDRARPSRGSRTEEILAAQTAAPSATACCPGPPVSGSNRSDSPLTSTNISGFLTPVRTDEVYG